VRTSNSRLEHRPRYLTHKRRDLRQVIFFACSEAYELGSLSIEPGHMLLGLLRAEERLTDHFLHSAGSVELIRKQIEGHTSLREKPPIDRVDSLSVGQLPLRNRSDWAMSGSELSTCCWVLCAKRTAWPHIG
jgi:hypothetical protein